MPDQSSSLVSNQIQSYWIAERILEQGRAIVIDIGKTHARASLWSHEGECLEKLSRANASPPGEPYPVLDTAATADWLVGALRHFSGHPIEAIVPVAHGAALAGIRNGALAFTPPDYEWDVPRLEVYRAGRDPFAVTGSPLLPHGLNMGAQLHALEAIHSFEGVVLLPYAQYWAWLLSGVAVCEVTSLGCHSDLWSPAGADFSPMARQRGWAGRFAPMARAGDAIGTLLPGLAEVTGLSPTVRIHAGLHDSNAALHAARGFAELEGKEATVLSTGTWFVGMRTLGPLAPLPFRGGAGGGLSPPDATPRQDDRPHPNPSPEGEGLFDLAALPEARDCLINVDIAGQPIPSARWMGGREMELLGERIDLSGLEGLGEVLGSGAMVLPAQVGGNGPFPGASGHWIAEPPQGAVRRAAAALYAALMADTSLDLIGARDCLLIEGRFAASELFTAALAALRPATEVYTASAGTDVSFGALRLVWPELRPAGKLERVRPLEQDLTTYRQRWHALVQQGG